MIDDVHKLDSCAFVGDVSIAQSVCNEKTIRENWRAATYDKEICPFAISIYKSDSIKISLFSEEA